MNNEIRYNLIRSKRKTISVEITDAGMVLVRAPKWTPKYEIDAFLMSYADWIRDHQEKMAVNFIESAWIPKLTAEELQALKESARADIMARIEKWAPIVAPDSAWAENQDSSNQNSSNQSATSASGGDIISAKPSEQLLGEQLHGEQFHVEQLHGEQLTIWNILTGSKPKKTPSRPRLTIRSQKTLWGSCTPEGNLSFNCLLMFAPEEVRDYVVVHELCHLKHLDHSKAFWRSVERALPNYRKHKKWLKENGHTLLARLD